MIVTQLSLFKAIRGFREQKEWRCAECTQSLILVGIQTQTRSRPGVWRRRESASNEEQEQQAMKSVFSFPTSHIGCQTIAM